MRNWLKKDLEYHLGSYLGDIEMISKKDKDEEWKRDHYRYVSVVHFQRILKNLDTQITDQPPAPVSESTKAELKVLRDILNQMIGETA